MNLKSFLDAKAAKRDKRVLKEEIAKSVITSTLEMIDQKIQNGVEKAILDLNLKNQQSPNQNDLAARMDQFDLNYEEIDKKVDSLVLDLARITDKATSAFDRVIKVEEWKDSGLMCTKDDLFLFAWGMACIQTR